MFSTSKERETVPQFISDLKISVATDVANVFGRFGKAELRSVGDSVKFEDIFVCLAALRIASSNDRYIKDGGIIPVLGVKSLNIAGLLRLFALIITGEINGIQPSPREKESIKVLTTMLRNVDEDNN
jgi:hypothetical protein